MPEVSWSVVSAAKAGLPGKEVGSRGASDAQGRDLAQSPIGLRAQLHCQRWPQGQPVNEVGQGVQLCPHHAGELGLHLMVLAESWGQCQGAETLLFFLPMSLPAHKVLGAGAGWWLLSPRHRVRGRRLQQLLGSSQAPSQAC